jgi:CBS domain-containing protein
MTVLNLCDEIPASVPLSATAADAIRQMLDLRVGAVAVVDDHGVVAGIFTERDVLQKLALEARDPATISIRDVMTVPVIMATKETTAQEALSVMVEEHHRHLPIVEEDGRLLGMLSIRNLLQDRIDDLTAQLAVHHA